MTPDELRAQIRTLWSLDYCNERCVEVADAAADAWEADVASKWEARNQLGKALADGDILRKRLEAAEKPCYCCHDGCQHDGCRCATLAGEKK